MPFYAIAIPRFAQDDFERIEAYRRAHDPQGQARILPHFTLVFGIDCDKQFFIEEIARQAEGVPPIAFELRVATLDLDPRSGHYLEHLVPEKGYAALVRLHDRLYAEAFTPHQRLDLGYVPHITIGRCERPVKGKERVKAFNREDFMIEGTVDRIHIFEEGSSHAPPLATIELDAQKN